MNPRRLYVIVLVALAALARADPEPEARRGGARRAKINRQFEEPEKTKLGENVTLSSKPGENRDGKFFPIFSVVQFRNLPCTSNAGTTGSGNQRNGTCYTTTECQDRGGSASGNCALGFGVCCTFQITSTNDQISQNCTYLQNPGFPSATTDATALSWTVNKCSDDVCFLRLDFETFTLQGAGATDAVDEGTCLDTFTVTTSTTQTIPTICGENAGYHMYIDIGANSGDTATLAFTFQGTATNRMWDIKVTQVECSNPSSPRDTCLQYHTGVTGRIETFNYRATADNHLNNQNYAVCIRPEQGFCCVMYSLCPDQPEADAFSLDNEADATAVMNDDDCLTFDHITIPESAAECSRTGTAGTVALKSRYCGPNLTWSNVQDSMPICDCTPPFYVGVYTNAFANNMNAANQMNAATSKGLCLEYTQIPC